MNHACNNLNLAIDGGGTHCRIALFSDKVQVQIEIGSVNVISNFEGAISELCRGLTLMAQRAVISVDRMSEIPAYCALAGVCSQDIAQRVAAALPLRHVQIEDDRHAALRGALGTKDGLLAHCGTGSFFAAQFDKKARFVGGWGPVLDDTASAQWVGRKACKGVLDAIDGLHPHTSLTRELLARFGHSAEIVSFAARASPVEFGRIARDVTCRATDGDVLAIDILKHAVQHITSILQKIGWRSGVRFCLSGGLGPHYKPYLPPTFIRDLTPNLGDPLSGAIHLARSFGRQIRHEYH